MTTISAVNLVGLYLLSGGSWCEPRKKCGLVIFGLLNNYRPRNLGRCNLLFFWSAYAMKKLQAKLNRLAENLDSPIAVILEGRDTAGKSSTIRKLTHYLPPDLYSVCLSHKPSKRAMSSWLGYWQTKLPQKNQIVFFDRSWYSRAMVQHLNLSLIHI